MTERLHTHYADDATLAYLARQEEAVRRSQAQVDRLREALRELYGAAHEYLDGTDGRGRMKAGTPRLNAALGAAFRALGSSGDQ